MSEIHPHARAEGLFARALPTAEGNRLEPVPPKLCTLGHAIEARVRRLLALLIVAMLGLCQLAHAQSSSVLQVNQVASGGETRLPSAALQPASALTVEAWVTASAAQTNYPAFVSYGQDTSPYESYILQAARIDGTSPADFYFLTGTGTVRRVYGTTFLQPGTQYFIVATYDGASAKIYVNGVLEQTISATGNLYYPGTGLGLGRKYTDLNSNFTGTLRGVAIYNAALSASTISAHYSAGPPTPAFQLSEVASGGETRPPSGALQPASTLTVEAWIKGTATQTGYPAFISYGQDTAPYESYILQANSVNGTKAAELFFLTGSGTSQRVIGTTPLAVGTEYYVVASYDGSSAKIYVNGVLENILSTTGNLYYPGGGLGLGRKYSLTTNNFNGVIRGVAIYGTVLPADRILARYQAGSPPTIPQSFTATAASGTQINLSWSASTDQIGVAGYLIERCQGSSCTNFAEVASATATTFSNTGLTGATAYRYRIRAVNTKNNASDYSSIAAATTSGGGGDTTPPTMPSGLGATAVSSSQINLSWTGSTDNVGVVNYRVERCQGAGCSTFGQIATPTGTTYSDPGLSASTSYSYRVRAADAVPNFSGYSNTATATTSGAGDTQAPTAPSGLVVIAASSNEIDLAWSASTDNVGVTSYLIERCQGGGCSTFSQVGTSATTSYYDTGRSPTTSYSYRVRAKDAANNLGGYSNTVGQQTPASSPDCN